VALEAELAAREHDLTALKVELQTLQGRYLRGIGPLYRRLGEIEAAVVDAEVRRGLRPPVPDDEPDAADALPGAETALDAVCAHHATPSVDLKRIFRDVARAIHPDLALDEPARCRRHSLMAEANRAYADRDEDRLRLILRAWERDPQTEADNNLDEGDRVRRRLAAIDDRLAAIAIERSDLETSAICRLQRKIDEACAQGWDLFAEMTLQVEREIARASARLTSLQRAEPLARA
jgi:hypothetical protein